MSSERVLVCSATITLTRPHPTSHRMSVGHTDMLTHERPSQPVATELHSSSPTTMKQKTQPFSSLSRQSRQNRSCICDIKVPFGSLRSFSKLQFGCVKPSVWAETPGRSTARCICVKFKYKTTSVRALVCSMCEGSFSAGPTKGQFVDNARTGVQDVW